MTSEFGGNPWTSPLVWISPLSPDRNGSSDSAWTPSGTGGRISLDLPFCYQMVLILRSAVLFLVKSCLLLTFLSLPSGAKGRGLSLLHMDGSHAREDHSLIFTGHFYLQDKWMVLLISFQRAGFTSPHVQVAVFGSAAINHRLWSHLPVNNWSLPSHLLSVSVSSYLW